MTRDPQSSTKRSIDNSTKSAKRQKTEQSLLTKQQEDAYERIRDSSRHLDISDVAFLIKSSVDAKKVFFVNNPDFNDDESLEKGMVEFDAEPKKDKGLILLPSGQNHICGLYLIRDTIDGSIKAFYVDTVGEEIDQDKKQLLVQAGVLEENISSSKTKFQHRKFDETKENKSNKDHPLNNSHNGIFTVDALIKLTSGMFRVSSNNNIMHHCGVELEDLSTEMSNSCAKKMRALYSGLFKIRKANINERDIPSPLLKDASDALLLLNNSEEKSH